MMRVLIVDHDAGARRWIRAQLAFETGVEAVSECTNVSDAMENIRLLRPDVVITEAEIGHWSCFDMLLSLSGTKIPYVIVVTDTDKHALNAFDANVIDYILKPIDGRRFRAALLKVRRSMDRDAQADRRIDLDQLVNYLKGYPQKVVSRRSADKVPIRFGRGYRFIHTATIAHIEAAGNSVDVCMVTGEVLHAGDRMFEIEPKLPGERFLRVHRSAIVNMEHVREVRTSNSGYEILMNNNRVFKAGSTYKANIRKNLLSSRARAEPMAQAVPA